MTAEQLGGTIRTLMSLLSGFALAWGFSSETWVAVTGGAVALGTWAWSLHVNKMSTMANAVASSSDVKSVKMATTALANSTQDLTDNPKVS